MDADDVLMMFPRILSAVGLLNFQEIAAGFNSWCFTTWPSPPSTAAWLPFFCSSDVERFKAPLRWWNLRIWSSLLGLATLSEKQQLWSGAYECPRALAGLGFGLKLKHGFCLKFGLSLPKNQEHHEFMPFGELMLNCWTVEPVRLGWVD